MDARPGHAICRYLDDGSPRVGLLTPDGVLPATWDTPLQFLGRGSFDAVVAEAARASSVRLDPDALRFLPPTEPRTMLYCGRNFEDHLAENPRPRQDDPVFFAKLVSSLIGHRDAVRVRPSQRVDYEGELAVVIGRRARDVPAHLALDYVAGFTIANDVTDRAVQKVNNQTTMGKGPDTFGPLGPWLVPAEFVGDGRGLGLRTWVNGELRQDGNTRNLIHDVAACIASATRTVTLLAGDVIATGTPAGCGAYMDPPTWLRPGDTVTVEVDGLGALSNPIETDPISERPRAEL
jgi:2-keto-4-pentenoate hydratase/2-oxohepta-3-ene-1,7-dioic acid hydratase in catechol pathway